MPRVEAADFYRHTVERAELLAGSTHQKLAGPVRARDASAYFEARLIGDGFIKVGEAAMAADPLSSSGIQLAIQSGIAASVIVNTLLRRPSSSEIAERFCGSRKARRMTDRSRGRRRPTRNIRRAAACPSGIEGRPRPRRLVTSARSLDRR
jgi:flavin-dependent dehydrogenase